MARIRTIKPEFFTHYALYEAEKESGLPLRISFAGLWTQADREGRFQWIPPQLKLGCLPYDDLDFSRVLDALTTRGFIVKYRVNGKDFGFIPGFAQHQVINNRESQSSLPEPNDTNVLTRESRVDDASLSRDVHAQGEGKGKEGKGKEGKGKDLVADSDESADDEKSQPKWTEEDRNLAAYMLEKVRDVAPSSKGSSRWPDDIRLMRERDGNSHAQIREMFDWANRDEFWKANILSPSKLREKWAQLEAKRNTSAGTRDVYDEEAERRFQEWIGVDGEIIDAEVVHE